MYAIKFRNEDGNKYLAERLDGKLPFWSSARSDAWLFFNPQYAKKIASLLDKQVSHDCIRGPVHVVQIVPR